MPLLSALKGICKQVMTPQNEYQRETKNSGISKEAGLNHTGNVIWPLSVPAMTQKDDFVNC